jgi:hypothetical protein
VVKQLQVSQYMESLPSATPLDIRGAVAIVLEGNVPAFEEHGMGVPPANAPLRYSEGAPVQAP